MDDLEERIAARLREAADTRVRTWVELAEPKDATYALATHGEGEPIPLLTLKDVARIAAIEAEA